MSTTLPIATLSLNPTVDIAFGVRELIPGGKTHSTQTRYDPGGNGINVSRSLKRLGVKASTCCIIAGESGILLKTLLENEVDNLDVTVSPGATRINCNIQQRRPPEEYKIVGIGPDIDEAILEQITKRFIERATGGYGVMTGSLPPGTPRTFYTDLCQRLHDVGAKPVIDAKSEVLSETIQSKPFLIKPNWYELEVMCGKSLSSVEQLAQAARTLQQQGPENVCVSLSGDGAIYVDGENSYYGNAPKVRAHCSVGAGDAMLAGMLAAIVQDQEPEEILRLGIACGSGTTTQPGTQLFEQALLIEYQENMEIRVLDI